MAPLASAQPAPQAAKAGAAKAAASVVEATLKPPHHYVTAHMKAHALSMAQMRQQNQEAMAGWPIMPAPPLHGPALQRQRRLLRAWTPRKPPRVVHRAADAKAPIPLIDGVQPVLDRGRWFHALLEQLEGRYLPGRNTDFRWEGQMWYGTDINKFMVKSEGTWAKGVVDGGIQQFLYSRAISPYWDFQTGIRADLDSGPADIWGAVGVQGLSLYEFELQATGYFNATGVAARLEASYDILITKRLFLQPEVELNFYSQDNIKRGYGRGLSDIDGGLRLRYEFWRKFAPYIGVTYEGPVGHAAWLRRHYGKARRIDTGLGKNLRFTFGLRTWF
ncbi:copper resistance protein B [Formicincola oecophyllae]|uniref:Copper resistance protein B n=1 Tax=Formicincola oecophyllae TaxID=2558361 RepID=A0A4Y6U7X7_9PROT|nr:copper resistance protein B [Formicincola oecophyllae]QDH13529.1 copper resistance protein B [Formicincola oecophyllae]